MEDRTDATKTYLRLTPDGKVVLLLLVGFLLGALNTGTNLLYFFSGLLGSSFLASAWTARRLAQVPVSRVGPEVGVQGRPLIARVLATPERFVPFAVGVSELSGPQAAEVGFVGIEAGATAQAEVELTFLRRGRHDLPGVRVRSRAPFGLIEAGQERPDPWSVLVLPATRPVRPDLLEASSRSAEALARRWRGNTEERRDVVRSLRDHRPGDEPRSIHWRSTARRGALVVKEFERTAPDQAAVLVDLASGDAAVEDAAVTLAASILATLVRRGQRTTLGLAGAGAPRALAPVNSEAGLGRGLRALARLESASAPDLVGVTRRAASALNNSRVFVVTTRSAPAGVPPGAKVFRVTSIDEVERFYADGGGA